MCGPTTCVETCPSMLSPKECKYGCFCADGYVRESDSTGSPCIKREQCPTVKVDPVCSENEVYSTCVPVCAPACTDIRYPLPKPLKFCPALCKAGCACKKGYYRADDGKCVTPEDCCAANERYTTCGSACVATCDYKPQPCKEQCVVGCFCSCSDNVRQGNYTGSPCINPADCSKKT
jgi:hypothetical protein